MARRLGVGPLLVFGPRSLAYDFGPQHPLTPKRFGPGIDLLHAVGAEPGLAPEPAPDEDLLRVHLPAYVAAVRRFSGDPTLRGAMGIGLSDNPAFDGMHEAGATVAAGSLRAMEAILRGDVDHAYQPGGGLHHAMPDRAWGFCIYNDPALAVVRARADGLRVMYVDLDVHHGDGVQAMTYADPGVLTVSWHESGRYLFPETGFVDEVGEGAAAGSAVNMPFEPFTGESAWLGAVRTLLPTLAAVFGPDVVVSQHGADSHAWDPLAHLRVTTTAHAEAARLVDAVAHRWAGGRWLATGGGGYDAYRVVPRTWALTWLAGSHREPDEWTPVGWRERWEGEAAAFGTPGMPDAFLDPPNAGQPVGTQQLVANETSLLMLERVRRVVLPALVREAEDRGWWRPSLSWAGREILAGTGPAAVLSADATGAGGGSPVVRAVGPAELGRLLLAARTIAPFDPDDAMALLRAAAADGARIVGAVDGDTLVGLAVASLAVASPAVASPGDEVLLALGVEPSRRQAGVGTALLRALVEGRPSGATIRAVINVAERDVIEPLDVALRMDIATRLLQGAGFEVVPVSPDVRRDDPWAISALLRPA
ncbi:MAG TPA: acetoin utilization protein AcuC [Candidatus Limnocylindrales bacterium]|nr:acetoin utilization protein AcuC [Candidatus Limnocylindrales bacterium]